MSHPSHKDQLANLNRIEGQIRGIAKMIDDEAEETGYEIIPKY